MSLLLQSLRSEVMANASLSFSLPETDMTLAGTAALSTTTGAGFGAVNDSAGRRPVIRNAEIGDNKPAPPFGESLAAVTVPSLANLHKCFDSTQLSEEFCVGKLLSQKKFENASLSKGALHQTEQLGGTGNSSAEEFTSSSATAALGAMQLFGETLRANHESRDHVQMEDKSPLVAGQRDFCETFKRMADVSLRQVLSQAARDFSQQHGQQQQLQQSPQHEQQRPQGEGHIQHNARAETVSVPLEDTDEDCSRVLEASEVIQSALSPSTGDLLCRHVGDEAAVVGLQQQRRHVLYNVQSATLDVQKTTGLSLAESSLAGSPKFMFMEEAAHNNIVLGESGNKPAAAALVSATAQTTSSTPRGKVERGIPGERSELRNCSLKADRKDSHCKVLTPGGGGAFQVNERTCANEAGKTKINERNVIVSVKALNFRKASPYTVCKDEGTPDTESASRVEDTSLAHMLTSSAIQSHNNNGPAGDVRRNGNSRNTCTAVSQRCSSDNVFVDGKQAGLDRGGKGWPTMLRRSTPNCGSTGCGGQAVRNSASGSTTVQRKASSPQWNEAEDAMLRHLLEDFHLKWAAISLQLTATFGIRRTGKQCRERWCNHVNPEVKKGGWTPYEDAYILRKQKEMGNRWAAIAKALPGRTENAVKNRFISLDNERSVGRRSALNANCSRCFHDSCLHSNGRKTANSNAHMYSNTSGTARLLTVGEDHSNRGSGIGLLQQQHTKGSATQLTQNGRRKVGEKAETMRPALWRETAAALDGERSLRDREADKQLKQDALHFLTVYNMKQALSGSDRNCTVSTAEGVASPCENQAAGAAGMGLSRRRLKRQQRSSACRETTAASAAAERAFSGATASCYSKTGRSSRTSSGSTNCSADTVGSSVLENAMSRLYTDVKTSEPDAVRCKRFRAPRTSEAALESHSISTQRKRRRVQSAIATVATSSLLPSLSAPRQTMKEEPLQHEVAERSESTDVVQSFHGVTSSCRDRLECENDVSEPAVRECRAKTSRKLSSPLAAPQSLNKAALPLLQRRGSLRQNKSGRRATTREEMESKPVDREALSLYTDCSTGAAPAFSQREKVLHVRLKQGTLSPTHQQHQQQQKQLHSELSCIPALSTALTTSGKLRHQDFMRWPLQENSSTSASERSSSQWHLSPSTPIHHRLLHLPVHQADTLPSASQQLEDDEIRTLPDRQTLTSSIISTRLSVEEGLNSPLQQLQQRQLINQHQQQLTLHLHPLSRSGTRHDVAWQQQQHENSSTCDDLPQQEMTADCGFVAEAIGIPPQYTSDAPLSSLGYQRKPDHQDHQPYLALLNEEVYTRGDVRKAELRCKSGLPSHRENLTAHDVFPGGVKLYTQSAETRELNSEKILLEQQPQIQRHHHQPQHMSDEGVCDPINDVGATLSPTAEALSAERHCAAALQQWSCPAVQQKEQHSGKERQQQEPSATSKYICGGGENNKCGDGAELSLQDVPKPTLNAAGTLAIDIQQLGHDSAYSCYTKQDLATDTQEKQQLASPEQQQNREALVVQLSHTIPEQSVIAGAPRKSFMSLQPCSPDSPDVGSTDLYGFQGQQRVTPGTELGRDYLEKKDEQQTASAEFASSVAWENTTEQPKLLYRSQCEDLYYIQQQQLILSQTRSPAQHLRPNTPTNRLPVSSDSSGTQHSLAIASVPALSQRFKESQQEQPQLQKQQPRLPQQPQMQHQQSQHQQELIERERALLQEEAWGTLLRKKCCSLAVHNKDVSLPALEKVWLAGSRSEVIETLQQDHVFTLERSPLNEKDFVSQQSLFENGVGERQDSVFPAKQQVQQRTSGTCGTWIHGESINLAVTEDGTAASETNINDDTHNAGAAASHNGRTAAQTLEPLNESEHVVQQQQQVHLGLQEACRRLAERPLLFAEGRDKEAELSQLVEQGRELMEQSHFVLRTVQPDLNRAKSAGRVSDNGYEGHEANNRYPFSYTSPCHPTDDASLTTSESLTCTNQSENVSCKQDLRNICW